MAPGAVGLVRGEAWLGGLVLRPMDEGRSLANDLLWFGLGGGVGTPSVGGARTLF